ncbi:hypothetical protein Trydic_g11232 [Trypoxylus dichotomus]
MYNLIRIGLEIGLIDLCFRKEYTQPSAFPFIAFGRWTNRGRRHNGPGRGRKGSLGNRVKSGAAAAAVAYGSPSVMEDDARDLGRIGRAKGGIHGGVAVANEVGGRRGRRCSPLLIANSWPPLCTPPINWHLI